MHQRLRTATAVVGLAFPILLVFVQLGLSASVLRTATLIYDAMVFDVAIVSRDYASIWKAGRLPRTRLAQVLAVPGVRDVLPVYFGFQLWRNVETGVLKDMLVIGCDPRRQPFALPEVIAAARALQRPDTGIVDRRTHPRFGPHAAGVVGQLGGRRLEVV